VLSAALAIFALAALPFVLGFVGERLLFRYRQRILHWLLDQTWIPWQWRWRCASALFHLYPTLF